MPSRSAGCFERWKLLRNRPPSPPLLNATAVERQHGLLVVEPFEEENKHDADRLFFYCRFIGVSDLAAVRFSLPSQLLEPTPNLEYWTYLDAPNAFIAIGTSNDPLDRMLEVIRFWLTKDLKYAKGKPCKPYNSCLGEFFRVRPSLSLTPVALTSQLAWMELTAVSSATGKPRTTLRPSIPRTFCLL